MSVMPLGKQLEDLGDGADEVWLDSGLFYCPDEPVRIMVRRRDGRYDMSDGAAALELAGFPHGWLAVMEDAVARRHLNVNRRGVVFVTGFAGRDLGSLAMDLADCSRTTYLSLLESADD